MKLPYFWFKIIMMIGFFGGLLTGGFALNYVLQILEKILKIKILYHIESLVFPMGMMIGAYLVVIVFRMAFFPLCPNDNGEMDLKKIKDQRSGRTIIRYECRKCHLVK